MRRDQRPIRWNLALLLLVLAVVLLATLHPFEIRPPNAVHWLRDDPGLSFRGAGIAHTRTALEGDSPVPLESISVEVWIEGEKGSQNWGAREILSLYDGGISPPFLLGLYSGRVFLFSRHEEVPKQWYEQFHSQVGLVPERTRFVAATYGEGEKSIFLDGLLLERRPLLPLDAAARGLSGRLVLGNSPSGSRGWWGRIKGLAIFRHRLTPDEISRHGSEVERNGVRALSGEEGLLALYPFDEGMGRIASGLVPGSPELRIPERFSGLPQTLLRFPGDDPRSHPFDLRDLFQNVLLFIPLGLVLASLAQRTTDADRWRTVWGVVMVGAVVSLGIELVQLSMPGRLQSTVDVAANSLGAGLGALLPRRAPWRREPHS